jgi:hypothetical protein
VNAIFHWDATGLIGFGLAAAVEMRVKDADITL